MAKITRKELVLALAGAGDNPCLSGLDLRILDMSGLDLNEVNMSRANLRQTTPLFAFRPEWQYTTCA